MTKKTVLTNEAELLLITLWHKYMNTQLIFRFLLKYIILNSSKETITWKHVGAKLWLRSRWYLSYNIKIFHDTCIGDVHDYLIVVCAFCVAIFTPGILGSQGSPVFIFNWDNNNNDNDINDNNNKQGFQ